MSDSPADRPQRASSRRGGLGRGLGALIPSAPAEAARGTEAEIDITRIQPNPYQPRAKMDEGQLHALVESIRTHGIIQPLVVRRAEEPDRYVLIAGERRWRAAEQAGLRTVPIIVMNAAPQAMLELALVENVVRADLSPLEEAQAYRQLIEEFGLTQADVASRVGRSRVSVTNTLRLLSAPAGVQEALSAGEITEGHARALLGLPSAADQLAMLEAVTSRGWTVRQTEEAVRRWLAGRPARDEHDRRRDPKDERIEGQLRSALGTKVTLRREAPGRGGSVTIHFFSDEELEALMARVVGEDLW
jgi:ParB family chromosome partitioning protein